VVALHRGGEDTSTGVWDGANVRAGEEEITIAADILRYWSRLHWHVLGSATATATAEGDNDQVRVGQSILVPSRGVGP